MEKKKFVITDISGEKVELTGELVLHAVEDFMGEEKVHIGLQLHSEEGPYAMLTVSFGEMIGIPNTMYVDTNNCYWAHELLEQDLAQDTGLTKSGGFCSYPLWLFNEEYLKAIGGEKYQQYIKQYDEY